MSTAYYRNEIDKTIIGDINGVSSVGIEIDNNLFELQWDSRTRRLILWTDGDLIIKCKSGNTVILKEDKGI